jgi:hypothetical protein
VFAQQPLDDLGWRERDRDVVAPKVLDRLAQDRRFVIEMALEASQFLLEVSQFPLERLVACKGFGGLFPE